MVTLSGESVNESGGDDSENPLILDCNASQQYEKDNEQIATAMVNNPDKFFVF